MSRIIQGSALAAFACRPSLFGTPPTIASILGHGISTAMAERMLALPHTREKLDFALCDRLGDCPAEMTQAQSAIALLEPAGLTRLALRTGAAWNAVHIARTYDGPSVRALVERIGPEFRDSALADLATQSSGGLADPSVEIKTEDLPAAIVRDGTACLVAWCELQPRAIGWRVLIRIRMNARPGARHVEAGPALVEQIAIYGKTLGS